MADSIEQLLQKGFEHFRSGRLAQAEGVYRKILDRQPRNHEAVHMLAVVAHKSGRSAQAAPLFAKAIELAPDNANYLSNAGKFFAEQKRDEEAVRYYRRAAQLHPNEAAYHTNLAESLRVLGQLEEAEAACRAALEVKPDDPSAIGVLGNVLREQGRIEEALVYVRRSVELRPYPATHDTLLFTMFYHPGLDPVEVYDEHRKYEQFYVQPGQVPELKLEVDRNPDRPLRIGYVSPDFHYHPVMDFMEGVLRHHDRAHFQVFCYSSAVREDQVTARLKKLPLTFRNILYTPIDQAAELIQRDKIDLLVDLAGHTANNRLPIFAFKPAPVRITYLGHPGTTGLTSIQYRLTDAVVDPPGLTEHLYTEELIRLPAGMSCFTPPSGAPPVTPLPALSRDGVVTFGSLHGLAKINDRVVDLWARVLSAVPRSRLLMMRNTLKGGVADRYRQAFASRGIDPTRLELTSVVPLGTHLVAYKDIDIALDVFPFCGHTTACEGLYMGVPIVTLPGNVHSSRLVAGVLTEAALPELVAKDEADFVSIASRLASDLPTLATLRSTLRPKMLASPLCDEKSFTRHLEQTYRDLWRRYCTSPA